MNNLNDITFVDADTNNVKTEVINLYEKVSGRTLAEGDPVRLFLESVADELAQLRSKLNYTGKMNLLAYAKGDFLDHLGVLVDTTRIPASAATTTLKVTLSAVQPSAVIIPAGTRVTTEDKTMFFATDRVLTIVAGQTEGTVSATCTDVGVSGNGYVPGQLKMIVDPVAYVDSIVNITTSAGGASTENDDAYRERIHEAPESFSCAGPAGAYEFWAKTASSLIVDVKVISPEPGHVNIYPLLADGEIPGDEILADVNEVCNDSKIRPLTDLVTVAAPTAISYDIELTYHIASDDAEQAGTIQAKVAEAVNDYVNWQRAKLGRDLDPSKLYQLIVAAGACKVTVTSPVMTSVDNTAVAVASDSRTVTYGGVADD